ncbi:hypothetical protein [Flavobacterium magnum]|uniref:hypothetical protein n=1 Tax=Flavobacterium magnum TaxID=2162713 RepID=UPI0015E7067A|nr:hypothetical protein [Flavobacterium magnum]
MNKRPNPHTAFAAQPANIACNFRPKALADVQGNLFFDMFQYPQEKLQIIYANIRV